MQNPSTMLIYMGIMSIKSLGRTYVINTVDEIELQYLYRVFSCMKSSVQSS